MGNLLLRPILARAGLPELGDSAIFGALQESIIAVRDQDAPDWQAAGRPLAALLPVLLLLPIASAAPAARSSTSDTKRAASACRS